jgi:Flp pilus assembly protein CpaB
MRHPPRALAAWAAAVLVALATAHLVATDLAALHRRARSLGPPRPVVVAARDLPLGAVVTGADVRTVRLPGGLVAPGAVDDARRAVGRVVAVPAVAGATLFERQLTRRARDGLSGIVPDDARAVRVVTEDGFRPEPGAVVDVLASFDPALGGAPGAAVVVARAARVLDSAVDGDSGGGAAPAVGVTLLVARDEAPDVAFAAANGVLTLALAPPEAACCRADLTRAEP